MTRTLSVWLKLTSAPFWIVSITHEIGFWSGSSAAAVIVTNDPVDDKEYAEFIPVISVIGWFVITLSVAYQPDTACLHLSFGVDPVYV